MSSTPHGRVEIDSFAQKSAYSSSIIPESSYVCLLKELTWKEITEDKYRLSDIFFIFVKVYENLG